jgi:hypothetical protein
MSLSKIGKDMENVGRSLRKTHWSIKLIAVILSILLASTLYTQSAVYRGGWEVKNGIEKVTVNDNTFRIGSGTRPQSAPVWGLHNLRFDIDDPQKGTPNIQVEVGPAREKVFTPDGWVNAPQGKVFKSLSKSVGETAYFFDQHVFFFDVSIIATPDFVPPVVWPFVDGEAAGMGWADTAEVSLELYFESAPWVNLLLPEVEGDTGTYLLDEDSVWSGVMSAQVVEVESKFIGKDNPATGLIDPYNVKNALVNMRADSGTYVGSVTDFNEQTMPIDKPSNIAPTEIFLTVGGELSPGYEWPAFATLSTYPAQLKYTIRVDVLTEAGYVLESGDMDSELGDIEYEEGSFNLLGALGDWLGSILPWAGLGGIIGLIIVAVVGVIILKSFLGRRRN